MDKYETLREAGTSGANYDFDTDGVIKHLKGWDEQYGISVSDAKSDAVTVEFDQLPDDTLPLAKDIYEFCPDTIDQGFWFYKDEVEGYKESGEELPEEIAKLVAGVDFGNKDFGLELLSRALSIQKSVMLWWD